MMFIDAIFVKIRDGQVANRPIYVAIGVTVESERDKQHRTHGALGWSTPTACLNTFRDNVPGEHN